MRVESPRESRAVAPTARWLTEQLADVDSEWTLNWGSTRNLDGQVIQPPAAVRLCSDKRASKTKLYLGGVPTPIVYDPESALVVVTEDHLLVGRPDQHARGRDFHVCLTPMQVERAVAQGCTHFTELVNADREFRVHVIKGRVVKISEKVGGTGIIRNHRNGWTFRVPTLPKEDRGPVREAGRQAVETLGLDLGAVDVLYRNGRVWVTEVNAAPSLTDPASNTGAKYVRWIKEVWGE